MEKTNSQYNYIFENIDKNIVLKALNNIQKNQKLQEQNKLINTFANKLEQISKYINNANIGKTSSYVRDILNIMRIKGANDLAINNIKDILITDPINSEKLYNLIDSIKLQNLIGIQQITNKLDQDFLNKLFFYKKLNKTTSEANIGNGELFLALLIEGSRINGLDDLNIHEKEYNIKYISKSHKNSNAIISIQKSELTDTLISTLESLQINENNTSVLNFPNKEKISQEFYKKLNKDVSNIIQNYSYSFTKGYILVGLNTTNVTIKLIRTNDILKEPLRYLQSLNTSNHFGFYFKGNDLYN